MNCEIFPPQRMAYENVALDPELFDECESFICQVGKHITCRGLI